MQDDEIYDKYIKPKGNIDRLSADYLKNLKKVLDTGLNRLIANLEIRAENFKPQAQPLDILEKMKSAKNVKFFLKDKVLRIENKNIEDVGWLEEFGEEYFFKDGADIIEQLYIWMKAGIKIEFKA